MKKEIWKRIPGYGIWYEISSHGNVRSYIKNGKTVRCKREAPKILKQHFSEKFAYLSIELSKGNGVKNTAPINILVATVFVHNPNPKKYKYVNHKDGDKLNNYYENLEWCTQGQNQKHAYDNGLRKKPNGSLNGISILNEKQVVEIFNSIENHYKLASEYGVERVTISNIKKGKSWSTITGKYYKSKPINKLSDGDVIRIFNSLKTQVELAKKYNVSRSVISGIKTGRSYSNITKKTFLGIKEYNYYGLKNTVGRRA